MEYHAAPPPILSISLVPASSKQIQLAILPRRTANFIEQFRAKASMTQSPIIREAKTKDAAALNNYVRQSFTTARHLITKPTEFRMGVWRQRYWIARKQTNPYEICLIATVNDKIVGMLECWTDRRKRVKHTTGFAMSVDPAYQGRGIGKLLLQKYIDWVRDHKHIERIELHVHSDNAPALTLYKKMGFKSEGVRQGAVRYEDGRIVDDILMALWP